MATAAPEIVSGSSGKSSGKPAESISGKSQEKVVANPEVEVVADHKFATTEIESDFDDDFEFESEAAGILKGWRIEKNSNGYYRYRWQLKNEDGEAVTHIMSSGKTGYKRGSKYLPRLQAVQELGKNGKKKRKAK